MIDKMEGQNTQCLPVDGGPIEVVHVSKWKPLWGEPEEENQFVPDLSGEDWSSEWEYNALCASCIRKMDPEWESIKI